MAPRRTFRAPGRPADPPELRVLKGNPQRRPIRAPVDTPRPDGVPPYPPTLKAVGKKKWDTYWQYGEAWLASTDVEILTELCELHDQLAAIRRKIDREGWFVVSEDTGRSYQHALVNSLNGVRNRMLVLWIECHMTPSSRGRANVKPKAKDELAEWEATGGG
jgi:P27 family predicted phage terminase small subunit